MARTKPGTMPTASTTTKHPSSLGMRSSTAPPALGSTGPHLAGAFVEPADAGTPADAIPVPSTVNHDVGPLAAVQGNLRSEMFNDQNATVWTFRDLSVDKSSGFGGGLQSTMNDARPVVLEAMKTLLVFTNDRPAGGGGGTAAGLTVASKTVQHSTSPSLKDSQAGEPPGPVIDRETDSSASDSDESENALDEDANSKDEDASSQESGAAAQKKALLVSIEDDEEETPPTTVRNKPASVQSVRDDRGTCSAGAVSSHMIIAQQYTQFVRGRCGLAPGNCIPKAAALVDLNGREFDSGDFQPVKNEYQQLFEGIACCRCDAWTELVERYDISEEFSNNPPEDSHSALSQLYQYLCGQHGPFDDGVVPARLNKRSEVPPFCLIDMESLDSDTDALAFPHESDDCDSDDSERTFQVDYDSDSGRRHLRRACAAPMLTAGYDAEKEVAQVLKLHGLREILHINSDTSKQNAALPALWGGGLFYLAIDKGGGGLSEPACEIFEDVIEKSAPINGLVVILQNLLEQLFFTAGIDLVHQHNDQDAMRALRHLTMEKGPNPYVTAVFGLPYQDGHGQSALATATIWPSPKEGCFAALNPGLAIRIITNHEKDRHGEVTRCKYLTDTRLIRGQLGSEIPFKFAELLHKNVTKYREIIPAQSSFIVSEPSDPECFDPCAYVSSTLKTISGCRNIGFVMESIECQCSKDGEKMVDTRHTPDPKLPIGRIHATCKLNLVFRSRNQKDPPLKVDFTTEYGETGTGESCTILQEGNWQRWYKEDEECSIQPFVQDFLSSNGILVDKSSVEGLLNIMSGGGELRLGLSNEWTRAFCKGSIRRLFGPVFQRVSDVLTAIQGQELRTEIQVQANESESGVYQVSLLILVAAPRLLREISSLSPLQDKISDNDEPMACAKAAILDAEDIVASDKSSPRRCLLGQLSGADTKTSTMLAAAPTDLAGSDAAMHSYISPSDSPESRVKTIDVAMETNYPGAAMDDFGSFGHDTEMCKADGSGRFGLKRSFASSSFGDRGFPVYAYVPFQNLLGAVVDLQDAAATMQLKAANVDSCTNALLAAFDLAVRFVHVILKEAA